MLENDNLSSGNETTEDEISDIVSDLLYTLFATLEEYTTLLHPQENIDGKLSKISVYVEKEMRMYAKALYNVELEPTQYDYMLDTDDE